MTTINKIRAMSTERPFGKHRSVHKPRSEGFEFNRKFQQSSAGRPARPRARTHARTHGCARGIATGRRISARIGFQLRRKRRTISRSTGPRRFPINSFATGETLARARVHSCAFVCLRPPAPPGVGDQSVGRNSTRGEAEERVARIFPDCTHHRRCLRLCQ